MGTLGLTTHLVHAVAPETFVVHGNSGLGHHDVRLEARRERHRVNRRFRMVKYGEILREEQILSQKSLHS